MISVSFPNKCYVQFFMDAYMDNHGEERRIYTSIPNFLAIKHLLKKNKKRKRYKNTSVDGKKYRQTKLDEFVDIIPLIKVNETSDLKIREYQLPKKKFRRNETKNINMNEKRY